MHRYKISDAVNLAEASYQGKRHPSLTTKIARSLDMTTCKHICWTTVSCLSRARTA